MERQPPSHLVRLLNQHLAAQNSPDPTKTLKAFFPYLYPNASGGIQTELLSALLFQLERHGVAKTQFAIDTCNQFGHSTTLRDTHPLSLRTQTKTDVFPVLEWFDAVFEKAHPDCPCAPFLYADAWSRGNSYWFDNLLDGIDANALFRTHDFVFEFFGERFGRAVREVYHQEPNGSLNIGLRKRVTAIFERLGERTFRHRSFWEAMVVQLPPHPYLLATVFAKGPPVIEPTFRKETLTWFDQAFSNATDHATLLAEAIRQNRQQFSGWTPHFGQHPLLLSIGQSLLSAKKEAAHKVIDRQHFEQCFSSLEQAVLRGQHSLSMEPNPTPHAL